MHIQDIEIANFRRLQAVRVELAKETTLFVGANNSGKTSAMLALQYFLTKDDRRKFTINDFPVSLWPKIVEVGTKWESSKGSEEQEQFFEEWMSLVPSLDLWLHVDDDELHRVSKIIPTLDWTGGLLGLRLRLQPKKPAAFLQDFRDATQSVREVLATEDSGGGKPQKLWPVNMLDFLSRRLGTHFAVRAYLLDPDARKEPEEGRASPQILPEDVEPLDENPLRSLIRIDEISAQRGLGGNPEIPGSHDQRQLSEQLRRYFEKHLDPAKAPVSEDLGALAAIEGAQKAFDDKLGIGFARAFEELHGLGYPGLSDPKVTVSTRLSFVDGLSQPSVVQYEVGPAGPEHQNLPLRLPESYNGLGYQNLISMSFRLMSFRDAWMRVGKAEKDDQDSDAPAFPPLHLVLVEEPEAYLHPQVQQVFMNKAYQLLRNHKDLQGTAGKGASKNAGLCTQLVVSTHSSHIAHEVRFEQLRYFRRLPSQSGIDVPTSKVVNLSTVFGNEDETSRFVTRYVRASHCDLFFADAAILVEGTAERILIPHFIRRDFVSLHRRYVTLLEVGGSHAHRLRHLIETLGLTTLIITDLDATKADPGKNSRPKAARAQRGSGQKTSNPTLRGWLPTKEEIDTLLDADAAAKESTPDASFAVRVAYQIPLNIAFKGANEEAIPYTFEDALVLSNLRFFEGLGGGALVGSAKNAIDTSSTVLDLTQALFEALRSNKKKGEFALDVISAEKLCDLRVPEYIREGLDWLQTRFDGKADSPGLVQLAPEG